MFQRLSSLVRLRAALPWILGGAAWLIAIYNLPYHFPPPPAISLSYVYGYNNRIALGLILLGSAAIAYWAPPLGRSASPDSGLGLSRKTLRKAVTFNAAVCAFFLPFVHTLRGFDESVYLIDRAALAANWAVPYRDFEFAYGPLFIYGPAWLARGLHLALPDAYCILWLCLTLAGPCLLYATLLWTGVGREQLLVPFVLFAFASILGTLTTGLNYTLFRFILGPFLGVLLVRILRCGETTYRGLRVAWVVPFTLIVLAVSPELALSFALGAITFVAWWISVEQRRDAAVPLAGSALLLCGVFAEAVHLGEFRTLFAFGNGGFNFPITPNLFPLLVLSAVGVAAWMVGDAVRRRCADPLLMLVATSLPALAAAFGRCDWGHLLLNPCGLVLAAVLTAEQSQKLQRWYPEAFAVCFLMLAPVFSSRQMLQALSSWRLMIVGLTQSQGSGEFDSFLLRSLERSLKPPQATALLATWKASTHPSESDMRQRFNVPTGDVLQAPFGFFPDGTGTWRASLIDTGRFLSEDNVVNQAEVEEKVTELRIHSNRELLMPPNADSLCEVPDRKDLREVRLFALIPFRRAEIHSKSLVAPLCTFINSHYVRMQDASTRTFGYSVWRPIKPPAFAARFATRNSATAPQTAGSDYQRLRD